MRPSGTQRQPSRSPRQPTMPSRCTSDCSILAELISDVEISHVRSVSSSEVSGPCQTWKFDGAIPLVAAALGVAHALAGHPEALPLVVRAVEEFHRRQAHNRPAFILLCAGMSYLRTGRIDEAASHAQEALVLARR